MVILWNIVSFFTRSNGYTSADDSKYIPLNNGTETSDAEYMFTRPKIAVDQQNLSYELYIRKKLLLCLEDFLLFREKPGPYSEVLKIESHHPKIFKDIRRDAALRRDPNTKDELEIENKFFQSFQGIANCVTKEKGGASGVIFAITNDRRYRLKGLTKQEGITLKGLIEPLAREWKTRPHCLICRVYGLYSIKCMGMEIWFQVMEDVFSSLGKPDEIYDMKGSNFNRKVGSNPIDGDVLKDLDLRLPVLLPSIIQRQLEESLYADCQFLMSQKLMDYSLLLGIKYEINNLAADDNDVTDLEDLTYLRVTPGRVRTVEAYSFGIIDYLQEWDIWKRGESCLKVWANCIPSDKISAIEPVQYSERFVDNLKQRLFHAEVEKESEATRTFSQFQRNFAGIWDSLSYNPFSTN